MPKLTGKSLPVSTRCTPGCAFAFSQSMDSIKACGWGERSRRMCSMRGSTTSSAKRVWPVTLARPSTRRRGLPITFMLHSPCGFFDGLEDLLIPRAPAKIPRDGLLDSFPRRILFMLQQRLRGHENARRAVAALGGAKVGKRGLQGVQLGAARQALHRVDRAAAAFHGEHQAG